MPLPPEFRVTETDGTLRIEWDNNRVAKDNWGCAWLVFAWVLFSTGTLAFTLAFVLAVQ